MRIYISGPITDNPNYIDDFAKAEQYILSQFSHIDKISILNPVRFSQAVVGTPLSYEGYLSIDIKIVSLCSHIYFLKGWHYSYGCQLEYLTALQHNLVMLFQE